MSGSDFSMRTSWTAPKPPAPDSSAQQKKAVPRDGDHRAGAMLAAWPVVFLGVVALCVWTSVFVPEMRLWVPLDTLLSQIRPLSVVADHGPGRADVNPSLLLADLGALALALIAWTPLRHSRVAVLGAAAILSFGLYRAMVPLQVAVTQHLVAVVVAAVIVGVGLRSITVLPRTGPASRPELGFRWPVLVTLTAVVPIALGRAVVGGDVALRAARRHDARHTLDPLVSQWFVVLGACIVFAVWAALQLVPPWRKRSLALPVTVLITATVLGFGYALQAASLVIL
jgi:hypothetical protein